MFEVLPKDLIRLLLWKYMDGYAAVLCMRVSKLFYQAIGNEEREDFLVSCVKRQEYQQHDCHKPWEIRGCQYVRFAPPFFHGCLMKGCLKKVLWHSKSCPNRICRWCDEDISTPSRFALHIQPGNYLSCRFVEEALRLN